MASQSSRKWPKTHMLLLLRSQDPVVGSAWFWYMSFPPLRASHPPIGSHRLTTGSPSPEKGFYRGVAYPKEGRNRVKVKDLKPKRIKDYLEYKFSQKSPALLKYLLFNEF
ncbi:hypothetical protein GQ457_05G019900 [Hibiscus cannabinus]